jgi:hypothetical protein
MGIGENMTFRISFQVLTAILGFSLWASAQTESVYPDKKWIYAYQTKSVQFISHGSDYAAATPGRHPEWAQYLVNRFLSWQPIDLDPRPEGECDLFKLRESIRNALDVKMRTLALERYHSKCQKLFTEGPSNPLQQAIKIFSMKYNVDENPFLHRVLFHLPDGQKLKGVLALKDTTKSRPLIIVRAGITGNVEEAFAERFFFYQLFERGLFNVLLVENMTGTDYIHFNKTLSFGGIAESYQNIWLAQTLRSSSQHLSKLIQSIHLVGLSLGGQGVLTSAWLARYQTNPKLFSSYLALCPLVNLTDTFDYLFKKSWLKFPLEIWARSRFTEFRTFRPELFKGYWGLPNRLLMAVAKNYKRPPASLLGVKEPWFIKQQTDFYSLHELSKWDPTLRDPVWIWVTNEDSAVPVNLNTDQLQSVDPVRIEEGNHCSFPVVWDNRVLSAILEGYILGASQMRMTEKQVKLEVDPKLSWDLTNVLFQDDKPEIEVELSAGNKTKRSFMINRSDLDFAFRSPKLSEHEKFMIRRWLSSNLRWEPDGTGLSLLVSWPIVK